MLSVLIYHCLCSFSLQYSWSVSILSPEGIVDGNVAVHGDSQQAEDGALSEHEDKASNEQASVEVGAKPGA